MSDYVQAMLPNLGSRGCVALVTGASRGIGKGISLQLGEAGASVYITGRNSDDLESTKREIADRGGKAYVVKVGYPLGPMLCMMGKIWYLSN